MMEKFVIDGRRRLSGEVTPSGNKNEALPCRSHSFDDEPVILRNVPQLEMQRSCVNTCESGIFSSLAIEIR